MCRGADLGVCCAQGCDEKIRCQDAMGYCDEHDPNDWECETSAVVDDPEKRRVYDLGRLKAAVIRTENSITQDERRLSEMRSRIRELTA